MKKWSFCLTMVFAATASAQSFRMDVTAVQVDVFVGKGGRAITGLNTEDFELYDNGALQPIEKVESVSVPVNVILVLDVSQSVRGQKLEYLKEAARAMLNGLEPKDGAALVTFSSVVQANTAFEGPRKPLFDALSASSGFGSTSLNDGLFAALKLAEDVDHPVVLLFTDGEDRFSWLSKDQVYRGFRRSEASVFIVATRQEAPRLHLTDHFFKELSSMSGGSFFEADSAERLPEIFREILAQLKTRYVLTFFPQGDSEPGWHELRVRLKNRRADVRARRGYYLEPR